MNSRRAIKIGRLCIGHQNKGDEVLELCGKRERGGMMCCDVVVLNIDILNSSNKFE